MREGLDVKTAAAGNWLVGLSSAKHLKYLVSVGARSEVLGVFDITGYHEVPYDDGETRVRFHISECDKPVVSEIPRMYGAFIYKHSSEVFDGSPVTPPPPPPPKQPAQATCPRCNLRHSRAQPDKCPW